MSHPPVSRRPARTDRDTAAHLPPAPRRGEPVIRPLAALVGDELDRLHRGFLAAFSDYHVPMAISRPALAQLVTSRGLDPQLSRVATLGEEIVAFWLTGTEPDHHLATDIATGVAPEHRRSGLAGRLWADIAPALAAAGFTRCSLEVIQENQRAIALYERLGFVSRRSLAVYVLPADLPHAPPPAGYTIQPEPSFDLGIAAPWWDWEPAWPGRRRVVERAGDDAVLLVARRTETPTDRAATPVGYAAVLYSASNLAQLAVAPAARRLGLGRALLAAAAHALPSGTPLRMLNVPVEPAAEPTAALLRSAGGEVRVRQFEMIHTLGV
jgi:ribosomal protein S18 acetylase RimI-like enzyme